MAILHFSLMKSTCRHIYNFFWYRFWTSWLAGSFHHASAWSSWLTWWSAWSQWAGKTWKTEMLHSIHLKINKSQENGPRYFDSSCNIILDQITICHIGLVLSDGYLYSSDLKAIFADSTTSPQYSIPQKFTTWIKSLISFKFDTDEKLFVETQ